MKGEVIEYAIFKEVSRYNFIEWLDEWGITMDEWDKFMEAGKKAFAEDGDEE